MLARQSDDGHMWVVIDDDGAALLELFEQTIAGRLALVVDIRFVGQAKNKNSASLDGLASVVKGLRDSLDDVVRHGGTLAFHVR